MSKAVTFAMVHGVEQAAETFKISERTIRRWLSRLSSEDNKIVQRTSELIETAGDDWARRVISAAVAVITTGAERKLEQLEGGADLSAKDLHAWAGALKLANDAETTHRLLEERKKPNNSQGAPVRPKPAPVVAIESREQAA